MKVFYLSVIAGSALMCGSPGVAGAATQIHTTVGASIWQVDSQAQQPSQPGGIVNERSTGNEPFMGPGASGGPTHSAPGATENTIKQRPKGKQQGTGGADVRGEAAQNNERQAFQRLESDPTVQGQDLVNAQREKRQ